MLEGISLPWYWWFLFGIFVSQVFEMWLRSRSRRRAERQIAEQAQTNQSKQKEDSKPSEAQSILAGLSADEHTIPVSEPTVVDRQVPAVIPVVATPEHDEATTMTHISGFSDGRNEAMQAYVQQAREAMEQRRVEAEKQAEEAMRNVIVIPPTDEEPTQFVRREDVEKARQESAENASQNTSAPIQLPADPLDTADVNFGDELESLLAALEDEPTFVHKPTEE